MIVIISLTNDFINYTFTVETNIVVMLDLREKYYHIDIILGKNPS